MKEIAEHLSYKWEMKYKDILIWFDFRSYGLKRTCKFIYLLIDFLQLYSFELCKKTIVLLGVPTFDKNSARLSRRWES